GSSGADAGGGGSTGPDAGDAGTDAGTKPCDLATAFPSSTPTSCGVDCTGLAIGDFNHDGLADVVVAVETDNNNEAGLALLPNLGDGTLGTPLTTRALLPCEGDPQDAFDFVSPDS